MNDLLELIERMEAGTSEERDASVGVVCRLMMSPTLDVETFNVGMQWLGAKSLGTLSPEAKFHIVEFVDRKSRESPPDISSLHDLIIAVQPVPEDNSGTWSRIEHHLVWLLQHDIDRFSDPSAQPYAMPRGGSLFCANREASNGSHKRFAAEKFLRSLVS